MRVEAEGQHRARTEVLLARVLYCSAEAKVLGGLPLVEHLLEVAALALVGEVAPPRPVRATLQQKASPNA